MGLPEALHRDGSWVIPRIETFALVCVYVRALYMLCARFARMDRMVFWMRVFERTLRGFRRYLSDCYKEEMRTVVADKLLELQMEAIAELKKQKEAS
jgi:hypothetical protein